MNERFLVIENGVVVNVLVGVVNGLTGLIATVENRLVGIGWTLAEDGNFLPPANPENPLEGIKDFGSEDFLASIPEA